MLEKLCKMKDQLRSRRAYLCAATESITVFHEAKALDQKITELDELISYIKFYNTIPNTYAEFLNSELKQQMIQEFEADFFHEKRHALKGIVDESEIDQLESENGLLYQQVDQMKKISNFSIPSFYQEVLFYLSQNGAIHEKSGKCILFLKEFEEYLKFILDEKEQTFLHEIKYLIQYAKVQNPQKLAMKIYRKLKENPELLSLCKDPNAIFDRILLFFIPKYGSSIFQADFFKEKWLDTQGIFEKFEYFRMFEDYKIANLRKTAEEWKQQYEMEMKQWSDQYLPYKYVQLKNNVKIYLYRKLNQILKEEYQDVDLISSGSELKNSFFQIYHFLTKQKNSFSMKHFYSFLFQQKDDVLKLSQEIEMELSNLKEEPSTIKEQIPKQKKSSNFIFRTLSKIKSNFVLWFEKRKGYQLNYTPVIDQKYDEQIYVGPKQLHKDYLVGLGLQIVEKIQTEFNSLHYSSIWKEEMIQKFPILNKNKEDITIADLNGLSNFYNSFFNQVESEKRKALQDYQILSIPKLPQNNFFLSFLQKYTQVDFNNYQKMSPEDIKYFLKLLRGILMDYSMQQDYSKLNENLLPEMKEQLIQTYFDALQYVSSGKSRN